MLIFDEFNLVLRMKYMTEIILPVLCYRYVLIGVTEQKRLGKFEEGKSTGLG